MKKMVLAAVLCMAFAAVFTGCEQDDVEVDFQQLDTPVVTADVVNWAVFLRWNEVDHATSYNIYRKEADADDSTKIARYVNGSSTIQGYDSNEGKWWYKTSLTEYEDGSPAFAEWTGVDEEGEAVNTSLEDGKSYVYFVEAVNGSMYSDYGTVTVTAMSEDRDATEAEYAIRNKYGFD